MQEKIRLSRKVMISGLLAFPLPRQTLIMCINIEQGINKRCTLLLHVIGHKVSLLIVTRGGPTRWALDGPAIPNS